MTTLPLMMATIAASLTVSFASATPVADFNNDGNVDTTDLVTLVSNLNAACSDECVTDLSEDGITDTTDLMLLMQQWGPVPGWVDDTPDEQQDAYAPIRDANRDMSWQDEAPVLLDAIYYDQYTEFLHYGGYNRWNPANEYNQGEHTAAWTAANNVEVQPMAYGGFDWDHDGEFTDEDKANFAAWLDQSVPADYDGPICLDLEGEWWPMLDSQHQAVVDVALDFYIEGLEYAQSLRPNAKIGFWGLPKKSHTNPEIPTASIQRLLNISTAIYPDVYENNSGYNDSARLQLHVERAIEMVNGEVPVYVQTSPRFKVDSTGYRYFHDQAEFMQDQIQSSLNASWTDSEGNEHTVSGIALWDAYVFVKYYTEGWSEMSMEERKLLWDEIDYLHIEFLSGMKSLIDNAASTFNPALQDSSETQVATASEETEAQNSQTESSKQQSRLVGYVYSGEVASSSPVTAKQSPAISYRSARRALSQAKRAFKVATHKYRNGSSQYQRAYQAYQEALCSMQEASRAYHGNDSSEQSDRTVMNQAKTQWKSANADSQETAETKEAIPATN